MEDIKQFLDSDKELLEIPMQPYQAISDFLKSLGWDEMGKDSNGWQHDFWVYYEKANDKLTFHGSWAWGNYFLSKEQLK